MRRVPLRRLLSGPTPAPERVLFTSLWFKGHNNPRYAELLPRLHRLDGYLFLLSDRRIPRGLQYRAYAWSAPARNPLVLRAGARRYRNLFTADNRQIPHFPGAGVVSDVDDPRYTPEEVAQLNRPNVRGYVVTAERAARRFEELGVEQPWEVIPQGISRSTLDEAAAAAARSRRADGDVVVAYMAAFLLSAADRGGDSPLYNVDHLLDLWEEIAPRAPRARLWLVGDASPRVRERVAGRDDVVAFGLLPRPEALATLSAADLALYPRTRDQGIQAAKVAEYLGLGLPIVSYDYEVVEDVREAGAGVLVDTSRAFADAVVGLVGDDARRAELAAAAARAGDARDWDVLARRYEGILERWLPPGPASR